MHLLQPIDKVEGVQAWVEDGLIRLLLVTDADDESTGSYLLEAELSTTAQANVEVAWLLTARNRTQY